MIGMSGESWRYKSTLSPIPGSQDYIGILIILSSTLFIFKFISIFYILVYIYFFFVSLYFLF